MGQYVVMHMEKRMEISPVLERHITRIDVKYVNGVRTETVYVPDNADQDKAALNKELISRERTNAETGEKKTLTINQAIRERIDEAGIKVRKNQNTALEMIFTGSHDTMSSMSPSQLDAWCQETLDWCADQWGRENMVSAVLHCDEETPHIHLIVVPIVEGQSRRSASREKKLAQEGKVVKKYNIDQNKARLSANEVYTQPRLYQYWDSYAEKVGIHFGLDRGIRAEPGSKKHHQPSIDFNRQLDRFIEEKNVLIATLTADYAEKEKEVAKLDTQIEQGKILSGSLQRKVEQMGENIEKNNEILKNQKSTFDAKKAQIAEQNSQITKNEGIIKEQTKKISSIVQIGQDATEKEIAAQIRSISSLEAEKTKLEQDIANIRAKLEAERAALNQVTKQIKIEVDLEKVPKKGTFGYKSEDVEAFIKSVRLATLKEAMNRQYPQISEVDSQYYKEVQRLQGVERQHKALLDSPEQLQGRLDYLKDEENKKMVSSTIEYVLEKRVSSIHTCTIRETSEGKDIFATFRLSNSSDMFAVHIKPDESFFYTDDPRVDSLEKTYELSREKIWWDEGTLSEIRKGRHEKDVKERYSNKLTSLLGDKISVNSFVEGNGEFLLFADNGRRYQVKKSGNIWSTGDKRVNTLGDCARLSSEKIWKNDGNVNEISQAVKHGRELHR